MEAGKLMSEKQIWLHLVNCIKNGLTSATQSKVIIIIIIHSMLWFVIKNELRKMIDYIKLKIYAMKPLQSSIEILSILMLDRTLWSQATQNILLSVYLHFSSVVLYFSAELSEWISFFVLIPVSTCKKWLLELWFAQDFDNFLFRAAWSCRQWRHCF